MSCPPRLSSVQRVSTRPSQTFRSQASCLEALGRVVDRIVILRVLLIITFRSEFDPPWIGQPHVMTMTTCPF